MTVASPAEDWFAEALPSLPLSTAESTHLIEALGPYEDRPHVAVAVSGGADSVCLCLATADWARRKGGRVTALIVDHGLRAESGDEARQVAAWLAEHGIQHRVLTWSGDKPTSAIQARARAARYELMSDWCRTNGVLHLFLGHHADDQAETYLMRRARGSGLDGLAAMSAVSERGAVRFLRPFLGQSKARLIATMNAVGQAWIEDPSNCNEAFERVRVRQARAELPEAERQTDGLLARTRRLALSRNRREDDLAAWLAASCTVDMAGFARLKLPTTGTEPERAARLFSRVVTVIGGCGYPVSREKSARALTAAAGTLGRCAWRRDGEEVSVWRENRGMPTPIALRPGQSLHWDNRFFVCVSNELRLDIRLAPLGKAGWVAIAAGVSDKVKARIPYPARFTLPALWCGEEVFAVPLMSYIKGDGPCPVSVTFRPAASLGGAGFVPFPDFRVAPAENRVISRALVSGLPAQRRQSPHSEG